VLVYLVLRYTTWMTLLKIVDRRKIKADLKKGGVQNCFR